MQGTRFEPWSGKIPHAVEQLSLCATTTEPALYSPRATTTVARAPRARAPQQEKPLQWEAHALQQRPNATINKKVVTWRGEGGRCVEARREHFWLGSRESEAWVQRESLANSGTHKELEREVVKRGSGKNWGWEIDRAGAPRTSSPCGGFWSVSPGVVRNHRVLARVPCLKWTKFHLNYFKKDEGFLKESWKNRQAQGRGRGGSQLQELVC